MGIDYSQLRSINTRDIIRALEQDEFFLKRQKGSHRLYKHADGRFVTVSFHHLSDSFPPKTLKSMLEAQAKWTEEDLRRLGMI
ncbi:MAG: type II toxin-antitoxin system HicA family toxin [bacterium]|nr:type II toxin-antitoxin system HicA family toxin [bacterium]